MITINNRGRLGNAMFRNCSASILSKKFNMKVKEYVMFPQLRALCPKFYTQGTKIYETQINIGHTNFTDIIQKNNVDYGLKLMYHCQDTNFVLNYKKEILSQFDLQYKKQHKNDLFIHVRLGDCIALNRVPSIEYYIKAIEQIKFDKGYISTDTPSHEIVTYLMNKFNLTLYENIPAETINFAKDFGNLVLSNGTFSWWIAFLSKAESVFYPKGGPKWCGDIFGFDNWTPIDF